MSEPNDDKMCPYSQGRESPEEPGQKSLTKMGKPVRKKCPVCGRRIVTDPGPVFPPHKKKGWYKPKKKKVS